MLFDFGKSQVKKKNLNAYILVPSALGTNLSTIFSMSLVAFINFAPKTTTRFTREGQTG